MSACVTSVWPAPVFAKSSLHVLLCEVGVASAGFPVDPLNPLHYLSADLKIPGHSARRPQTIGALGLPLPSAGGMYK